MQVTVTTVQSKSSRSTFCEIQHLCKQNFVSGSVLPGGWHWGGGGGGSGGQDPAPPRAVAWLCGKVGQGVNMNTPLSLGSLVREGFGLGKLCLNSVCFQQCSYLYKRILTWNLDIQNKQKGS